MSSSFWRALRHASLLALAIVAASAVPVFADTPAGGALSGTVTSGDGKPIAGAVVTVRGAGGERIAHADRNGRFTLSGLAEGNYELRAGARGYDPLGNQMIGVRAAQSTEVTLTLLRSSSSLVTIGRVQSAGGALSTSSAPSDTLDTQKYADWGYTSVADVLQDDMSTTLVRPLGGSSVLPTSVALRGPDPTETLVDIDGHQVNNGNTGDFDFSLLDPADYSNIELVKGISPSSLVGPDTIDGAINVRTLDPTANPHGLLRVSAGSYSSFGSTLQATGTYDRLGYALSLHRITTAGETNETIFDASTGTDAQVGSALDASTALGKIRYAFGRGGDGYAELSFHDQSQFRDLSAALSSFPAPDSGDATPPPGSTLPVVEGLEGTALQAHNAGYGVDVRVPLGGPGADGLVPTSLLYRHYTSLVSESVVGPGAQTSPYLYNNRDLVDDETLELDRQFANSNLTLQFDVRNENLQTDFVSGVVNDESIARRVLPFSVARAVLLDDAPDAGPTVSTLGLGQTQRAAVLRYTYDASAKLHLTAAGYYSNYTSFGTSLDPRFGATYAPDARSLFRFSVGTTFQAPQLPELYVPPVLPQAVGGYVSIGNPNLQPDRATEYGLGVEHLFETGPQRTDVSVDFYRVNLRTPSSVYLPPLDPNCGAVAAGGDGTACPLSFPVNAGDAIYQGLEISAERRIAPYTTLRAGYAVRSAYLTSVPADIQDGTLVVGEQSQGLPLQKATFALRAAPPLGFGYDAGLVYEGQYNELNQPPFATLNAALSYRWPAYEISLAATNITDVYNEHFTTQEGGVLYGGLTGPLTSDAYALQGPTYTVTFTRRF
jgi:outer membrane receptor protein involved in Fe transport